jgi:small-conductance mechanosensitive channel
VPGFASRDRRYRHGVSLEWSATVIAIVTVLGLGVVGARLIDRAIANRNERDFGQVEPTEGSRQRVRTAQRVLRGLLVAVVVVVTVGVLVDALGLGSGPLLAIALVTAVLMAFSGAAWGSDIVSGISITLEGQYYEGDWLELKSQDIVGQVESLSLRATTMRSLDGTRWVIPNGEMRVSGNRTYDYSRYLFSLRISYGDDIERTIGVLESTFAEMELDPRFGPMVSRIRVLGVDDFGSSGIDIKLFLHTEPGAQFRVGREFRKRLKPALDDAGVTIPYEHREVILHQADPRESAA